jgi:hypothetical protein
VINNSISGMPARVTQYASYGRDFRGNEVGVSACWRPDGVSSAFGHQDS